MMEQSKEKTALVVVAHPDDEVLWCGGTILKHSDWDWEVISLCRGNDTERRDKFFAAAKVLGAKAGMGDLDDGPQQKPLAGIMVEEQILELAEQNRYDVIFTHSPAGEYTRHRRHEETGAAMLRIWSQMELRADEMRLFAYSDLNGELPAAAENADTRAELEDDIFQKKYELITKVYGFSPDSFEAKSCGKIEGFWDLGSPSDIDKLLLKLGGSKIEGTGAI